MAERCKPCTKIGKNLKPVITKTSHAKLKTLTETNQEIQLDFTGLITDNNKDTYILVSIDRYSGYPHAKAYHNCDTETAVNYLKSYIKFHGIPRTIRCDQAQAFKSRNFEIFCNDNNIKHRTSRRPQRQRPVRMSDTNIQKAPLSTKHRSPMGKKTRR